MDKFNTENPFRENPESELKRRLQSARPLTQEQFKNESKRSRITLNK